MLAFYPVSPPIFIQPFTIYHSRSLNFTLLLYYHFSPLLSSPSDHNPLFTSLPLRALWSSTSSLSFYPSVSLPRASGPLPLPFSFDYRPNYATSTSISSAVSLFYPPPPIIKSSCTPSFCTALRLGANLKMPHNFNDFAKMKLSSIITTKKSFQTTIIMFSTLPKFLRQRSTGFMWTLTLQCNRRAIGVRRLGLMPRYKCASGIWFSLP